MCWVKMWEINLKVEKKVRVKIKRKLACWRLKSNEYPTIDMSITRSKNSSNRTISTELTDCLTKEFLNFCLNNGNELMKLMNRNLKTEYKWILLACNTNFNIFFPIETLFQKKNNWKWRQTNKQKKDEECNHPTMRTHITKSNFNVIILEFYCIFQLIFWNWHFYSWRAQHYCFFSLVSLLRSLSLCFFFSFAFMH